MLSFLLWLAEQCGLAALRRWWSTPKPTDKEKELQDALEAKTREAEIMAAPARDKQSIIVELQQHEPH